MPTLPRPINPRIAVMLLLLASGCVDASGPRGTGPASSAQPVWAPVPGDVEPPMLTELSCDSTAWLAALPSIDFARRVCPNVVRTDPSGQSSLLYSAAALPSAAFEGALSDGGQTELPATYFLRVEAARGPSGESMERASLHVAVAAAAPAISAGTWTTETTRGDRAGSAGAFADLDLVVPACPLPNFLRRSAAQANPCEELVGESP